MTRKEELRSMAAQCWCDPRTSMIEMDTRLAEVFTEALLQVEREVFVDVVQQTQRYQQFTFGQERSREYEAGFHAAARTLEGWLIAKQQELT